MAVADQTDYEHRWLIDPRTGQSVIWTSDTGIDGEHPVDVEDLDLIPIDPVPSYVWYQDMIDFADGISDATTGERLAPDAARARRVQAIQEPGLQPPRADLALAGPARRPSPTPSRRVPA